jgi:mono/diheme cytochrome c family protein
MIVRIGTTANAGVESRHVARIFRKRRGGNMIRKLIVAVIVLGLVGLAGFYVLTIPHSLAASDLPDHKPDLANGKYLFAAGGCESCHAAPASDKCDDKQVKDPNVLAGGRCLLSPFGTFHVPNISPDPENGIGKWQLVDFVNAMKFGVRPDGAHLYPAFPYPSYQHMKVEDLIDLKAYLDTLQPSQNVVPPHELPFPFSFRRGLGLWKLLYIDGREIQPGSNATPVLSRGAYLVLGPAHCSECHSPRNFFGGLVASRAFSGGPAPVGNGYIPNITPDDETGIGKWSEKDIAQAFKDGAKPNGDYFGAEMSAVQRNVAQLNDDDRAAIAAFLKSQSPIHAPKPPKKTAASGS